MLHILDRSVDETDAVQFVVRFRTLVGVAQIDDGTHAARAELGPPGGIHPVGMAGAPDHAGARDPAAPQRQAAEVAQILDLDQRSLIMFVTRTVDSRRP